MQRIFWFASLCSLLLFSAQASDLVLFDSTKGAYLQSGPAAKLQQNAISSLIAAATGLVPAKAIDQTVSETIESLLKPAVLRKPRAYVVLNIAGVQNDAFGRIFEGRQHRTVSISDEECPATAIINALTGITLANPGVSVVLVDQAGLENCQNNCIEQHLSAAADTCQMQYKAGNTPLTGSLTFANGAVLNLQEVEDKLFAVEVASIYSGVKGQLHAVNKRAELHMDQEDVEVYEISLMGLHGLVRKYGAESSQVEGAKSTVLSLLHWAVQSVDTSYEGDLLYQVALFDKAPKRAESMQQLMAWKDTSRRQLLQASFPGSDEVAEGKRFSAKAAGYGAFILLLYFSLGAIYCMCNMPFKQDTLLYGSKKDN